MPIQPGQATVAPEGARTQTSAAQLPRAQGASGTRRPQPPSSGPAASTERPA